MRRVTSNVGHSVVRRTGFTLIEVLVVVAIIALLISILLPSLAAARERAKTVACVSNIRQLVTAFQVYASEFGCFPGSTHDFNMDWTGLDNRNKVTGGPEGRVPEDGTIYKYMGNMQEAYTCPKDKAPDELPENFSTWISYTYNNLMVGAKPETPKGAHYPTKDFSRDEHTRDMRPFDGVPLLVEPPWVQIEGSAGYTGWIESRWVGDWGLSARHNTTTGNPATGAGALGYADGHAGTLTGFGMPAELEQILPTLPKPQADAELAKYFKMSDHCVLTGPNRWVTGRAANTNESTFGILGQLPDASVGTFTYSSGAERGWDTVIHRGG